MTKEALKLALEALETLHDENMDYLTRNKLGGENNQCMVFAREAITAIKEALANEALEKMAENARELGLDYEPEQDWIERERAVGYREGHRAALAQRTWVGLTDIDYAGLPLEQVGLVRWAEAKLKEKNT